MATRQEKIDAAWRYFNDLERQAYDAKKEYKKVLKEAKDD